MATLSPPPSWAPELLERDLELARLESAMRDARAGEGVAVAIEAAAGLGKTRLVERMRGRAVRSGMASISARATELEREFPYGVVRQLFEAAVARGDDPDLLEGAAAAARPALGLSGGPELPEPVLGELSFSTLYGLYWLTVNLSQERPLLVTVDDAHWADTPSLQFLRFLTSRLAGLPILLIVASRPMDDDHASPLVELVADPAVTRINPSPLGPESTAKLLASALGWPPEDAFASACHELTRGNPFLVAELVRTLAAEGMRPTAENAAAVRKLVPDTIARAVPRRLAPLSPAARELARSVAVLGDGSEQRRAAGLSGLDASAAANAADVLRQAQILEPEASLRFVHPLVRNAVYAEIPAGARSRMHERAAALLAGEGMPAERIAIHLLATDPAGNEQVVATLREAAQAALDQGAPHPAVAYLRRALFEPAPADQRADIFELLMTAGLRSLDTAYTAEFEDELIEALTTDAGRLTQSAEALGLWLMQQGRMDESSAVLERAIAAAEEAGDLVRAVALEAQLTSFTQMPPAQAKERFARYDGRLSEGSREERFALAQRAWWGSLIGAAADDVADLALRAVADGSIFREQPHSLPPAQATMVLARADELDAAAQAAENQIETSTARGALAALSGGWYLRGYVAFRRGDLRAAEADAAQAVEVARQHGFLGAFPLWPALLIDLLVERDEVDAAEQELVAAGLAGELPDTFWFGPPLITRGRLRLAQGRARESAEDLLLLRERMVGWGIHGNPGTPAAGYAARALAVLGERDRALELAEEELSRAREWGAASVVGEALVGLGVVDGGEEGIAHVREAVRLLEASPARLLHASALVELGALLRREQRPADAREPLQAGLDLARRCGAIALARRAAGELAATGEKVRRYTPIGVDALTPSQRRVAEMAARGMTNREIAASLFVTIKTVESHLHEAYDKLGIQGREELRAALSPAP